MIHKTALVLMVVLCLLGSVQLAEAEEAAAGRVIELPQAVTGDFTLEWWQYARKLEGVQPVIVAPLQVSIQTSAAEAKKKSPRQQLALGDAQTLSQSFIYGNRWYHVALVHDQQKGSTQLFLNGLPNSEPFALAVPGRQIERIVVGGDGFDGMIDRVAMQPGRLSADRILSRYKSALTARGHGSAPVTVAHRGNHRYAPENTLVSYREAIAAGAPIMEIDLRLSRDGQAVLMHDETVDRTTNATGKVFHYTAADLASLDAGSWKDPKYAGEPVPTLEQVAQLCRGQAMMMLDLKPTGLGEAIAAALKRLNYPSDQVILAPWDDDDGAALRSLMPDVTLVRLGEAPEIFDDAYFMRMKQIGFSGFSFSWRTLSQQFIEDAHRHDMKVYTWTVNDPADVSGAVYAGVDGIITDDPRATRELIELLTR